jgi:hypothetical protein
MSCIPSAAYKIIRARCTVRNGNVTVLARRSSSARSSPESSTTYVLVLGTTHNSARPPLSLPIVRRTCGHVNSGRLVSHGACPPRNQLTETATPGTALENWAIRSWLLGPCRPASSCARATRFGRTTRRSVGHVVLFTTRQPVGNRRETMGGSAPPSGAPSRATSWSCPATDRAARPAVRRQSNTRRSRGHRPGRRASPAGLTTSRVPARNRGGARTTRAASPQPSGCGVICDTPACAGATPPRTTRRRCS